MKKLLLVLVVGLYGCSDLKNAPEPEKIKIGCLCKNGIIIPQNENLLKQTSNLTGESCLLYGGFIKYIYK